MAEKRSGAMRHSSRKYLPLAFAVLLLAAPAGLAQQKFETPQQTNERIRQLTAAFQNRPTDYLIGSGDVVKIEVFDVPDLTREVRVAESGYISLPLIPVKVRAAGLSAFQLEEKLAELLQVNGLVSHPQVTVLIREQRSQPITIIGAVRSPRVIQAVRRTTLLEVLSEAGGIADDAGDAVIVTRPARPATPPEEGSGEAGTTPPPEEPQVFTIKLNDLLDTGDLQFNIPVFGGDVISVPRAGIVYVTGAVERPGGFVLRNDRDEMTALRLVAMANGLKGTAKSGHSMILRKNPDTGKIEEIRVNLSKIMANKAPDVRLYPNDVLVVPDSTFQKVIRRTGEVALSITSGLVLFRAGR